MEKVDSDQSSNQNVHQINPNLNQLFIDQYRFWTLFRNHDNGLYCDGIPMTEQSQCQWWYSTAGVGWGLMIDAVAVETGLISRAKGMLFLKITRLSC